MTAPTDIAPVASVPFDSRQFRATMGKFATGVTIVTTYHEGQSHGMTANSFLSVSLDPPLVLVSVATRARLHALLAPGCHYGVSVLADDQEALSRHFAGRPIEGLHIPFVWKHGVPLIDNALAHVVARVVDAHPAGITPCTSVRSSIFQAVMDRRCSSLPESTGGWRRSVTPGRKVLSGISGSRSVSCW